MNKHKHNLEELRKHLNRDARGLKLLDAVSRDLTEQRKRIALLEEFEATAATRENRLREIATDAENKKERLSQELEAERARLRATKDLATRQSQRIAELESDVEEEDEAPIARTSEDIDPTVPKIMSLFKAVRKRFKRIPHSEDGRQVFHLEDLVKEYTGDEFMGLGMLMAALALHGFPAYVESELKIGEMKGWSKKNTAKFINWYRSWIKYTKIEEKCLGLSRIL